MSLAVSPQELEGFDILWRIIFESNSNQILNKGIDFLYNLFSKTKKLTEISLSSALTQLCLNEIKTTTDPQKQIKTILFLKKIIERSEQFGTADIISHNGLLRNNKITIEVSNNISSGGNKDKLFEMILYSNTTIYDLKKKISSIVNYHFDFIRFIQIIKGKDVYEITMNDNGKTLHSMDFCSSPRINLYPNHLENKIPVIEICLDKKPVDKVITVFHKWFDIFSTNNKMSPDDCGRFVKAVTNSQAEITASDSRVKDLFNERDKNKDGFIEREEFIEFYREAFPTKVNLVYDNLKAMGMRNDLLTMSDPYYIEITNKEQLPRYQLALDEEFFNKIFNLQKENNDLAKSAFDFIGILATNPTIYKRIKNAKGDDWTNILSDSDIVTLIYSLTIIESLIEKLSKTDSEGWVIEFIQQKGFEKLIKLFLSRLSGIIQEKSNYFTSLCFENLIRIVKIFCIAAIDSFDENNSSSNSNKNDDYLSILNSYLVKSNEISIIQSTLNSDQLISNLISLLDEFIIQSKIDHSKDDLINSIMELSTILIPVTLSSGINTKQLINFISYGIFHQKINTRKIFTESTIRMCTILKKKSSFNLIESIFNHCNTILDTYIKQNEKSSSQFFILFSYLIEILNTHQAEFKSTTFDIFEFAKRIVSIVEKDLNEVESISDQVFVGYINIITKISTNNTEIKSYISDQTNLIQGILSKVLFKQNRNDLETQYSNVDFIDVDLIYSTKTNNKGSDAIREICYHFILTMVKGSLANFEKFFNINVIAKEEENNETRKENRISNERKREGYVGLKNLGCICYMNSALQQFFMVPSFRYSVLRYNDNVKEELDPSNNVDDNMLHQTQRMFSYLELSERVDYNPFGFTYSFKEYDGMPTKLIEQKDSQEFIGIFLDRLENQSKNTEYKYVTQSIFGGKNCSQIICDQCEKVSNRFEDTLFLSVEVKNMKTLNESLDKLISEEKIDGYKCEGCNQNVSITKRSALSSLPNVLIIHLQRILYNFEYDRNEKINSRLEFPKQINLKPYTIEEMTRKNNTSNEEMKESDDIYFRTDAYYDYYLMGVIVHSGTADSGHYYSYINTIRGGTCNEATYNSNDQSMVSSWLEYNDSYISKYDVDKLEDDCFGGIIEEKEKNMMFAWNKGEKSRSAYMLVYERKINFPIKIIIDPIQINSSQSIISYKEEDENKIKKDYDILRYYNTTEFNEKQSELFSKIFFDAKKSEYYKYIPYYYENRKIPKKYFFEIESDNVNFEKMQSFSDENFTQFFNKIISLLEETMNQNKANIKKETAKQISSTFLNFILKILSKKDREEVLVVSIEKFINIVKTQPICQEVTWDYIKEHFDTIKGLIFNNNKTTTKAFTMLITELINLLIDSSKEELIQAINDCNNKVEKIEMTKSMKGLSVFESIISLFPKIPTKTLGYAGIYMNMIKTILNKMDEILIYFAQKEFLFIFITFLIGKDSPCFKDTQENIRDTWDHAMRSFYLVGAEQIIDLLYNILMKSTLINSKDGVINLSSRDISCVYSLNFLKYIFKKNQAYFNKFIIGLSLDNEAFSQTSCVELIKTINDIDLANESREFTEIVKVIIPLLNLKDKYQQNRFEILLGVPQYETESNLPYPLFGYNLMLNPTTKCFENHSTYKHLFTSCIIQIMYEVQNQYTCSVESFLLLLEACLTNDALLKYLKAYQFSNISVGGFIEWGVCLVNNYGQTEENHYRVKLKSIVQQLNTEAKFDIIKDNTILPGFVGFINDYLIKDVKMAEIQLMYAENDVYFFLFDYHADYIPLTNNNKNEIDFTNSKKFTTSKKIKMNNEEEQKITSEEEQKIMSEKEIVENNPFNSVEQYIIQAENISFINEKEFLQSLIPKFEKVKKIVIESSANIPNTKSVLRRIVGLNLLRQNVKFIMQLKRSNHEFLNEYIPLSQLNCSFNNNLLLEIYKMSKWDPEKEWTWNLNETAFDIKLKIQMNQYPTFNTYNGSSHGNFGNYQYNSVHNPLNEEETKDIQDMARYGPNIHEP